MAVIGVIGVMTMSIIMSVWMVVVPMVFIPSITTVSVTVATVFASVILIVSISGLKTTFSGS